MFPLCSKNTALHESQDRIMKKTNNNDKTYELDFVPGAATDLHVKI